MTAERAPAAPVRAVLLAAALVAASCTGDGAPDRSDSAERPDAEAAPTAAELVESLDTSSTGEGPVVTSGVGPQAGGTQLADLGVLHRSQFAASSVAVLRPDGTSAPLPDLPDDLDIARVAVAGETLLSVGIECEDGYEACDGGGRPVGYRYSPRDAGWVPLVLPGRPERGDSMGAVDTPLAGSRAVVSWSSDLFAVDPFGRFRLLPDRGSASLRDLDLVACGDHLVAVDRFGYGGPEPSPTVLTLDLLDSTADWVEAPDRPVGAMAVRYLTCGPAGIHFLGDGLEATYDPVAATWSERAVDLPVHLDEQRTNDPRVADQVVLSDGTIVATTASRAVVRRTPDGRWEDLDQWADELVAAGDTVYVSSREHPDVRPLR